jgi:hypothetical protein
MKILVSRGHDVRRYEGLITNTLISLGIEVTHDEDESDIDHLLMCTHHESHSMSKNFPVYHTCDKLDLVDRSERSGLGVLHAISPTSDQEIVDFMGQYGECIIKPRCGAGGTSLTLPLFYHSFNDASTLIGHLDLQSNKSEFFSGDWRGLNVGEWSGNDFILQDYRDLSEGTDAIQFYSRGFINPAGQYISEVIHTSDANPCPIRAERDFVEQEGWGEKGRQVYVKKNDHLGIRAEAGITEEEFNANVLLFIEGGDEDISIRSNWIQLGGMIIEREVYIFDVALSPSDLIKFQDPSRFASQAAWIYGLTEDTPVLQNTDGTNTWYTGVTCDNGFTEEDMNRIQDYGGRFIYHPKVGDEYALAIFVAESRVENEQNKNNYLLSL